MGALFDSPPAPTQTETPKIEVTEYEKAIFQLKVQKGIITLVSLIF
jgi:hypothetical protein